MICKKCSNEYDDSLELCPFCEKEEVKEKKPFKVTIDPEKETETEEALPTKKQQFLSECCLTSIRMRYDRKRTSSFYFIHNI